jgi:hypothetical protein
MAAVVSIGDLGGNDGSEWSKALSRNRPMRSNPDRKMRTESPNPGTTDTPDINDIERRRREKEPTIETGAAKGGLIKKVDGKPKGKDHGTVPAQRGEYVIKAASVKKYGPAALAAVNAGKAVITVPKKGKR